MRNDDSKLAVLRRLAFLHACSELELRVLATLVDEAAVEPDTVLMREGDAGREAFIIVEGWAAVSCGGEPIAAIGPGEFIGEMEMLCHKRDQRRSWPRRRCGSSWSAPGVRHAGVAAARRQGHGGGLAKRLADLESEL